MAGGRSVYDPLRDNQGRKWHKKWDQREERRAIRSGENPKLSEEADASLRAWPRPRCSLWGEGVEEDEQCVKLSRLRHFTPQERSCSCVVFFCFFFQWPGSQQTTSAISGHYKSRKNNSNYLQERLFSCCFSLDFFFFSFFKAQRWKDDGAR